MVKNWYYARLLVTIQGKGCIIVVENYLLVSVENLVQISESIWTMCYEINDFEPHSFPIFLIFQNWSR